MLQYKLLSTPVYIPFDEYAMLLQSHLYQEDQYPLKHLHMLKNFNLSLNKLMTGKER